MPSDYGAIAARNRTRYGTDIGRFGEVLLARLYSDRTHFIYEVLQNAEDAGATSVEFHLRRDRLEVVHDGRAFNEYDVIGVCGLVEGTKANDLTTIGRFGIGFKSVYAYTSSPRVHSGDEHFWIEDFVIPHPATPRRVRERETVLVFPFDRADVSATDAFNEIGTRLGHLGTRTLLFLRHIEAIHWDIEDGGRGTYLRETQSDATHRRITLLGEGDQEIIEEEWLVFSRDVSWDGADPLRVEAAFRTLPDDGPAGRRIIACDDSDLVVFFPTEKDTRLGFLIQGPYRTTPARDNVPESEPLNQLLVSETAALVADTLAILRDTDLLTVSCLEALPIQPAWFLPGSMFRPIFQTVADALATRPLLPTESGVHVPAEDAVLARGNPIRQLLADDQLSGLLDRHAPMRWLDASITYDRTPELRHYLMHELDVPELDPDRFARIVTERFIASQGDAWMIRLYRFLAGQEQLWRGTRPSTGTALSRGPILDKPFIRLESGRHVPPFDRSFRPNAFLSLSEDAELPIVRLSIAADDVARDFLVRLGLKEPDIVVDVINRVLVRYQRGTRDELLRMSYDEHQTHLQLIERAVGAVRADRERLVELLTALRKTPFLRTTDIDKRGLAFQRPGDCYLRTPALEGYFSGNSSIRFASEQYDRWRPLIERIGVTQRVRVHARDVDPSGYVTIIHSHGHHRRGVDGFDPDTRVEGLDSALRDPTLERCQYIWNEIVRPNVARIRGVVETATQQSYANARAEEQWSPFGALLRDAAWVPDRLGRFHRPAELTQDDLPEAFQRDDTVAARLGMRSSIASRLADELGVDLEELEDFRRHRDAFREFLARRQLSAEVDDHDDDSGEPIAYDRELEAVFSRPGATMILDDPELPGFVPDPNRRAERVGQLLAAARASTTPPNRMFVRVSAKKWQRKENAVRTFLHQQYGGRCQICGSTFPKRDGSAYFEGLYLISRTRAEWVDRPGNVLCLCASCCAKFQHGALEASSVLEQFRAMRLRNEGGAGSLMLDVTLCGELVRIRFSEAHFIELRALVNQTVEDQEHASTPETTA